MRVGNLLLTATVIATPLQAQIVGQTCGPNGCNPVFAAPPPSATALAFHASGNCGALIVDVFLFNETNVPVPNDDALSASLRANSRTLFPQLRTIAPRQMIAPRAFAGPIRYFGEIPADLSGVGQLQLGPQLTIEIVFDTLNPCPKPLR